MADRLNSEEMFFSYKKVVVIFFVVMAFGVLLLTFVNGFGSFWERLFIRLVVIYVFVYFFFLKEKVRIDKKGMSLVYGIGRKVFFTSRHIDWKNISRLIATKKKSSQRHFFILSKDFSGGSLIFGKSAKFVIPFVTSYEGTPELIRIVLKEVPDIQLNEEAKEYLQEIGLNA